MGGGGGGGERGIMMQVVHDYSREAVVYLVNSNTSKFAKYGSFK